MEDMRVQAAQDPVFPSASLNLIYVTAFLPNIDAVAGSFGSSILSQARSAFFLLLEEYYFFPVTLVFSYKTHIPHTHWQVFETHCDMEVCKYHYLFQYPKTKTDSVLLVLTSEGICASAAGSVLLPLVMFNSFSLLPLTKWLPSFFSPGTTWWLLWSCVCVCNFVFVTCFTFLGSLNEMTSNLDQCTMQGRKRSLFHNN